MRSSSPEPDPQISQAQAEPFLRDALILGLAVTVFGMAFGVLAVTNGLSLAKTMTMSLFVFTGASQFAAIGVIAGGGTASAAVASALLLAGRNAFYGMAMARYMPKNRLARGLAAHLTIDESTALAQSRKDPFSRSKAFLAAGCSIFLFWNLGTLAGAIGGEWIGDPRALGLDAAFPAGFISLMWPALRTRSGLVAALSGASIALVAIPFTQPGVPVLVSVLGVGAGIAVARQLGGSKP